MSADGLSMDALQAAVSALPDDSLAAQRQAALRNLRGTGLPTMRDENWKYTDLQRAVDISNRWLAAGADSHTDRDAELSAIDVTGISDANWIVIRNGRIDSAQFDPADGAIFERFSDAPSAYVPGEPLDDFNAALLVDGLRIRVWKDSERPIGILIADACADGASVAQAGVRIDVASGCHAEFIEYHTSTGDGDQFTNSVVTLDVAASAAVDYVRIQDRGRAHVQTGRLSVSLQKDARLRMTSFDLGGRLVRNDVKIDLPAPGAEAVFDGLYLCSDGQHIDNHTRVDHRVGPAVSSQEYRGILNGRSRGVWNGKAIVHKGADGTDAHQANHNLLLSERAEIDTKPELEIYADDVRCAHGATVGQLDEQALFYLQSRGIGRQQAHSMLTEAFAAGIVERIAVPASREAVSKLVTSRLQQLSAGNNE